MFAIQLQAYRFLLGEFDGNGKTTDRFKKTAEKNVK